MNSRIKINIISDPSNQRFSHQLPSYLISEGFDFYENNVEDIVWDMVVLYENVPDSYQVRCKSGGLVFISAEPPENKRYATRFLKQFDHVITTHPSICHPNNYLHQPAIDWWFGKTSKPLAYTYHFQQIEEFPLPQKTKKISFVASNQSALPGHIKRLRFLHAVKQNFGDRIDFFGRGFHQVEDKADALLPYMFSICIENSSILHYWTEKVADPFLAYTVPIYFGCQNIEDYFDSKSIVHIDVNDIPNSLAVIQHVLDHAEQIYADKMPSMLESRKKLLHEYNIFGLLKRFYQNYVSISQLVGEIKTTIHPQQYFFETAMINKFLYGLNFAKRFRYKVLSKLKLIPY
jgi:hypothetical protein